MSEFTAGTKLTDLIEKYGEGSVIQHGKLSDRVYLIKMKKGDFPGIIGFVNHLARQEGYTKIFCKVPSWATPEFLANGFHIEAYIPRFYENKVDVFFVAKFLNSDRLLNLETENFSGLSKIMGSNTIKRTVPKVTHDDKLLKLSDNHAQQAADLYRQVFKSYPFPIFDPEYIKVTIRSSVQYYGIQRDGRFIALASAEIDFNGQNAEMTDFATLDEFRGQNLSVVLLHKMEQEMTKQGITTLYTIARLNSLAMNKTFFKLGYNYAGTLIKNTNIGGQIESMNVLYKHIGL